MDENPQVHEKGTLPDCFIVYNEIADLKLKLNEIIKNYDFVKTPQNVFDIFYKYYSTFYDGNLESPEDVLVKIERKEFNKLI